MSRKLFIFDCFGVVVSDVSTLWMDGRFNDEQVEFMRKKVFRSLDVGAITMEQMFEQTCSHFGLNKSQMIAEWTSYEYPLTDTIDVIKRLREQGHCIVLLSNAAVSYVDYLFDKFDLHKYFDFKFVSAAYGYAKPDKEFYKLCVDSFDEQFEATYFTDDNPNNLVDLQQFGITPILFKNAKDFAEKVGLK